MITARLGDRQINCYDGKHNKEQLKTWAAKGIIFCPACGQPYEYCHGKIATPYFRHKDKTDCDRYSEPETEEHIKGKKDLFEWVKQQDGVHDVILEGWLKETHQRPDIMFKLDGRQYVIEYQCSPIASEYIERHSLYQAAGIEDIWIIGFKEYPHFNMQRKTIERTAHFSYDPFVPKVTIFKPWIRRQLYNAIFSQKRLDGGDDIMAFGRSICINEWNVASLTDLSIIDGKIVDTQQSETIDVFNSRGRVLLDEFGRVTQGVNKILAQKFGIEPSKWIVSKRYCRGPILSYQRTSRFHTFNEFNQLCNDEVKILINCNFTNEVAIWDIKVEHSCNIAGFEWNTHTMKSHKMTFQELGRYINI